MQTFTGAEESSTGTAVTFTDCDGNPVLWVFPSPGRIWKDRWVAFTNSEEFNYFKGSKDEVFKRADAYLSKCV